VSQAVPSGDWYCEVCAEARSGSLCLDTEASVSDPAAAPTTGKPSKYGDADAKWRLWPAPLPHPQGYPAPIDELGFERWNHINYDMDEEDVVFCRKLRISPDHFEWIIDRLEKVSAALR